jgi:hypothetical protein
MSIVRRLVRLNRIDPAVLSFRGESGLDTRLDLFYQNIGPELSPITYDLAAQLELQPRSGGAVKIYAVSATDVGNGKASARIPAGHLTDPNGYRLRLYGMNEPDDLRLLASGFVDTVVTGGPQATTADEIDEIPLRLFYANDAILEVKLWTDAGKTSPYNLAGSTVAAPIRASRSGVELERFNPTITLPNLVTLRLTASEVAPLPASCWWLLNVATSGVSQVLAEGPVTVSNVTSPV